MLTSLSIRDIVLIERLDLELEQGLCVLTGETGAGKSILLDSLGLALGGRADRGLVREGAKQGSVSAAFRLTDADAVSALLEDHGIEADELLLLRRTLGKDGRSRAFINDQPVGNALLKRLGQMLVEVHGQHDQQGLLDPSTQRGLVDAYGRLGPTKAEVKTAFTDWRDAKEALQAIEDEVAKTASDVDYWRHILSELDDLAPEPGEEDHLAETRAVLMNREKLISAVEDALSALSGDGGGLAGRLGKAQRSIERVVETAGDVLEPAATALDRLRVEMEEAIASLEQAGEALAAGDDSLETVEERLFALRAAARKHKLQVDDLPSFRDQTAERLDRIEAGDQHVAAAKAAADAARKQLVEKAAKLSAGRAKAGDALAKAVMKELPPLKLDKAKFQVRLVPREEDDLSENGAERVVFEVSTNPGQKPGPLGKIASGGELARFMLALKVALAMTEALPSLIFDEVDSGVGGATADAIGDRLQRLGDCAQVLVVTHAPQVAARAGQHLQVQKSATRGSATVKVSTLSPSDRREEIARMLAGAEITDAARAAADSLMKKSA